MVMLNDAACCAGTLYTTVQLATTGCHVPVNTVVQAVADVLVSRTGQIVFGDSYTYPTLVPDKTSTVVKHVPASCLRAAAGMHCQPRFSHGSHFEREQLAHPGAASLHGVPETTADPENCLQPLPLIL